MKSFVFRATFLLVLPCIILARDLSLIRIQDDAAQPSNAIKDNINQKSFLDFTQSKSVDFAAGGCDCVCDCIPGTDDCSCACICKNPEDEETAAAQKLLEEKRRLRLERQRNYERELQANDSLQVQTTPAPSEGRVEGFQVSRPPTDTPTPVPNVMPSTVPLEVPTDVPAPTPLPTSIQDEDCPQTVTPTSRPSLAPTQAPSAIPSVVTNPDWGGKRKLQAMLQARKSKRKLAVPYNLRRKKEDTFDFIVAGFPKCGTTTLLKTFAAHKETDMNPSEKCAVASPGLPDNVVLRKLDETISEMSVMANIKRSFKCPTAIYNHKTISRMQKHSPKAKFIIGVRHPVLMMQSFYNYRVTEIYQRKLDERIPSFEAAISRKHPWKGLSMDATRFDLFLKQFGKTDMTPDDLYDFIGHPGYQLAIQPNKFSVFLYTVDQIDDENEARNQEFRVSLQNYLGLSETLAPFPHENKNHRVGSEGYNETIDICEDRYSSIRKDLIEQGINSADWIRDQFIRSRDVSVSNEEHFLETLESWRVDPCAPSKEAPIEKTSVPGDGRNEIAEHEPRRRGLATRLWEAVSIDYFNQGN